MKNFLAYQRVYTYLKISDTKIMKYIVFILTLMVMFAFSPVNLFLIAVFSSSIQSEKYEKNIEIMALLPCSKKHDCYYYYFSGIYAILKNFLYAMISTLLIYLILSLMHADPSFLFLNVFNYDTTISAYRVIALCFLMMSLYLCLAFLTRLYHTSKLYIVMSISISFASMYFFFHSFENEMIYVMITLLSTISLVLIPWMSYKLEKRRDENE
ncbi:MAG: hypothetical protein ACLSUR_17055 [Coprobacillus cateniformis]